MHTKQSAKAQRAHKNSEVIQHSNDREIKKKKNCSELIML